jgi:bacitracin transport system permease protein
MKYSILRRLSFKSILNRKNIYGPYLLAIGFLFSLEYILLSLLNNNYVRENNDNDTLMTLLSMALFFITLMNIIIALYGSRFVSKIRHQEFGLYTVLGMENKHIRYMFLVEYLLCWLITSAMSVLFGFGLGKFMFIILNRMMHDTGATFMSYPFDLKTAILTVSILFAIFITIFILDNYRLIRYKPAELLSQANASEREPRVRILITLFGLVTLGLGYYVALTSQGVIQSMLKIFIAVLLVVMGTYCLFVTGSILVLKLLKKNNDYYYQAHHFLTISGMLYRMKANAVSLATIAILCSGIILTLSATVTLYSSMQSQINSVLPRQYELAPNNMNQSNDQQTIQDLRSGLNGIKQKKSVTHSLLLQQLSTPASLTSNGTLQRLSKNVRDTTKGRPIYLLVQTVNDFNRLTHKHYQLNDQTVMIGSNLINVSKYKHLGIVNKQYKVKQVDTSILTAKYGIEVVSIIVPDQQLLLKTQEHYQNYNRNTDKFMKTPLDINLYFDLKDGQQLTNKQIKAFQTKYGQTITTKKSVQQMEYHLYGGLLFIGMLVSLVLFVITILMLYFKQISEGYADRKNYQIMQQVGLPKELIKKTIHSQIVWLFVLPLIVGLIHVLFATNIMSQLMGIVGITNMHLYFISYVIVGIVFTLLYLIVYLITSSKYYHLINGN